MTAENTPNPSVVVIGASVGALDALSAILPALPADYPLPILVVVHIPPDRESLLSELFSNRCGLAVKEAEDKEPILPSTIYFAPPDYHLLVEPDFCLSLSSDEPVRYSRPSIDVLFESAADAYGDGAIGIILTGANDDGSRGLKAICAAGGKAIAQLPSSAEIATMPRSALEACPDAIPLDLAEIAASLKSLTADS